LLYLKNRIIFFILFFYFVLSYFFLPFSSYQSISLCFRWFRFISFPFRLFRFVLFRFVSFSLISFRFVSFLFRFGLYRYPYAIPCYLFSVMFIICNGMLFILLDFYKRLLIDRDDQIYIFRNVSTICIVILDNRSPIVLIKVKCIN
jgi:hypothetical protein